MLKRWIRRQRRQSPSGRCLQVASCGESCPLQAGKTGNCAVVVRVDCQSADACRLRALGVYEGARVSVVDSRNGLLLQVRGSRLAVGAAVAAAITVIPVAS